jgi:hypothetical protein
MRLPPLHQPCAIVYRLPELGKAPEWGIFLRIAITIPVITRDRRKALP